jgi:hypothetical protein
MIGGGMYRLVDCGTWDDPWFAELEPAAKLLFLYLITNHRTKAAGCFEITTRSICFETGLTTDRVTTLLAAFGERVRWWPDHQIVWIKNFYRRNSGEKDNPKFREGAKRSIVSMPREVTEAVCKEYPELRYPLDAPSSDDKPLTSPLQAPPFKLSEEKIREESVNPLCGEGDDSAADAASPPQQQPTPIESGRSKPRRAISTAFTVDDEDYAWAQSNGFDWPTVDREFQKFKLYHEGEGRPKKDWHAAFRSWLLKSNDFARPSPAKATANGRGYSAAELAEMGRRGPPT